MNDYKFDAGKKTHLWENIPRFSIIDRLTVEGKHVGPRGPASNALLEPSLLYARGSLKMTRQFCVPGEVRCRARQTRNKKITDADDSGKNSNVKKACDPT
uniref:Uncharacterized protein n=1 Tax=Romanomermis culicivorax TaxID=13658 RepID=A0A915JXY0_ROMCU